MKHVVSIFLVIAYLLVFFAEDSWSVPSFSRKYKTSCSTCHYAFPMLNGFGKAFKNNGYRYPGGDENYRKEEPVSLGSEGYKKVWPEAVWPSDIPGTSPLAVHAVGRINYSAMSNVKWEFELPHELEVLYAGTIGEDFSFFGEIEVENENNETEIAFPFALQFDSDPAFHVRAGMVRADPSPTNLRLTRNHYNVASFKSRNGWRFRDEHVGLEVWGAGNGADALGGFTYRFGVVNGQGLSDINPQKDIYGKVTYKIGGLGEIGGAESGESEVSEFYIDNAITLGGFFYNGTASKTGAKDEDFTVFGGDVDFWYDRFIANGTLMLMNSKIPNTTDRKSMAYYVQGNYVLYPWLIGLLRYEWEDKDSDIDTVEPVNAIIPGVTVMARANVKFILELKKYLDEANKYNDTFVMQMNFGI
ncbi:MAG: hypothetical protein HYZ34_13470 [Ignavibacteriae bacterium]|nr:hypothetical protein [Ignavibacteriota bacterium]